MPLPALAMLGLQLGGSAALGAGQSWLANRAQKSGEKRQEERLAKARLLQSFGAQAQPMPMGRQQPGVAQQMLADPLTKQLLAGLISKGAGALGGGGGVAGLQNPAQLRQPAAPTYSPDIRSFTPRFQ